MRATATNRHSLLARLAQVALVLLKKRTMPFWPSVNGFIKSRHRYYVHDVGQANFQ
ncbi:hypothetical protein [Ruegeria aquimaris]|uniref:hypothetical protein n=1 Tax=Ruegeria aquimaris TaxID=2984333 RepID=UPI0021E8C4FA|nr:hypothetical protein [Ruegeria sp. XHP0148]